MKLNMRKDACGNGVGASSTPSSSSSSSSSSLSLISLSSCFDIKPLVATLLGFSLLMALWHFQPYDSGLLLFSHPSNPPNPSCPTIFLATPPNSTTTTISSSSSSSSSSVSTPAAHQQQQQQQQQQKKKKMKLSTSSSSPSSSSSSSREDPNVREFRAYGSAAALFVQMGAYRGGPYTFAVVGLASKPAHVFGKPWFKCEWVPNNNSSNNNGSNSSGTLRAKAYKMLPDWGYGRVYTVVVVNCTFPVVPNADNAGGRLLLHAYYSPSPKRYERFVALEEAPGSYHPSRFLPPYQFDYLYCGSPLYGRLNPRRLREWIAYHARLFGPRSHFVFHDAGALSPPSVRAALEPWLRAGRATLHDVRAQSAFDGYYYNQFLILNDCLHRYRHAAAWTFFFDVDEYIYLPAARSLPSVLAHLSPFTQFTIEQDPMSTDLCVLPDPPHHHGHHSSGSGEWGFEKLVFRNSITGVRRDRKYAIQAKNAYATGVHMSENLIGNTTHKTESLIRYYHYHNSINVLGDPCREFVPIPPNGNVTWFEKIPYVYDDNMKRLADTVRRFEEQTIGPIQV